MSVRPPHNQKMVLRGSRFVAVASLIAAAFFVTPSVAVQAQVEDSPEGPEAPIGHSLAPDEAKRLIDEARTRQALKVANGKTHLTSQDVGTGLRSDLPPLVDGQYGFAEPSRLTGIPKAFVSLGTDMPTYGIVVEKLHHRLTVFRLNENKSYDIVKTFRAITGKDPGDKVSRGDLRTPEGIYFVTGRMGDDSLPSKYGRLAFTLDYPNIYDLRKRKSGYGIWIHATDDPSRLQKPFDTEGCVVLSNEDILELEKYISPFEIPVVITKEMTTVQPAEIEHPRRKALEMIEAWRLAWEDSEFDSYMKFYSTQFKSLGRNKNQWQDYKKTLSRTRKGEIEVMISEPKIVAFEGQLLAVFLQRYASPNHADFGRKFLYLQWEGDRYRIIAEKWYPEKKTESVLRAMKLSEGQM